MPGRARIGAVVYRLSFSKDGTLLQTDRGPFPISAEFPVNDPSANSLQPSSSIFVQDQWVYRRTIVYMYLMSLPVYRSGSPTGVLGMVCT